MGYLLLISLIVYQRANFWLSVQAVKEPTYGKLMSSSPISVPTVVSHIILTINNLGHRVFFFKNVSLCQLLFVI